MVAIAFVEAKKMSSGTCPRSAYEGTRRLPDPTQHILKFKPFAVDE